MDQVSGVAEGCCVVQLLAGEEAEVLAGEDEAVEALALG